MRDEIERQTREEAQASLNKWAGEAQERSGSTPVLLIERGEPVRFNFQFNFCRDCTAEHALSMTAQGRCQPEHLKRRAPDANR